MPGQGFGRSSSSRPNVRQVCWQTARRSSVACIALLITSISAGSVLGVIADRSANLGAVAYEMTLFASRAGGALTPRLIIELKNAVQS